MFEQYNQDHFNTLVDYIKRLNEGDDFYPSESFDDIMNKSDADIKAICRNHRVAPVTVDQWRYIVEIAQSQVENSIAIVHVKRDNQNIYNANTTIGSAWQSYEEVLRSNHFSPDSINEIRNNSLSILNHLDIDKDGPKKGLVIGNVQSGKTANMAALIAMAADAGWNMFIVLSGTIENLRIQTQDRLLSDLGTATNVQWFGIDRVNINDDGKNNPQRIAALHLGDKDRSRYLLVCLKQKQRLTNLIKWLNTDANARSNLKILVIDDEADQASVNVSKTNRTILNNLIINLVYNKNEERGKDAQLAKSKFKSMSYIAYTATPYANVLSEGPYTKDANGTPCNETLYPDDFVACLSTPKEHYGPQTIFGLRGSSVNGINIVSEIKQEETNAITKDKELPLNLKEAILWFYCCYAIRKHQNIKKPVSMLIHISQKTKIHAIVAECIDQWLQTLTKDQFINQSSLVYKNKRDMLPLQDFLNSWKDYPNKVDDYINFDEFKNELESVFDDLKKEGRIRRIQIDDDATVQFNETVHLCIDNSKQTLNDEDEHIRLLYPPKEIEEEVVDPITLQRTTIKKPYPYTTGFIVIGGHTLSRGLTIEGLVSTYFLRTVNNADTLMQMGRWFGYRRGYELLPRLWLTNNTRKQFEELSIIDDDLRKKIKGMADRNEQPAKISVAVRTHPKKSFLTITANNKSRAAAVLDVDYNGYVYQTTAFKADNAVIAKNTQTATDFIESLGNDFITGKSNAYPQLGGSYLWTNIDHTKVLDFIGKMDFPAYDTTFFNFKHFKTWFEDNKCKFDNWNILLPGLTNSNVQPHQFSDIISIKPVNRSKRTDSTSDIIKIGALRAPKDLTADVDITKIVNAPKTLITTINDDGDDNDEKGVQKYQQIRNQAGLKKTPLLMIYTIDGNSTPTSRAKGNNSRTNMGLNQNLIGLALLVPGIDESKSSSVEGVYLGIPPELLKLDQSL